METKPYSKKEIILETASVLFTKYGIQCLTMNDIASKCGISKKTIYKYFQNKTDLISQIIEIKIAALKIRLGNITSNSENAVIELNQFFKFYKEILSSFSPTLISDLKCYNLQFYVRYVKINKKIILPFIIKNIERGRHENLYRSELDIKEISESILNVMRLLFTDDALLNNKNSYSTLDFFRRSQIHWLVTIKGLEQFKAIQ